MNHATRNYKDTVFRMLFKEKPALLSLYNALNHSQYTNTEDLEITTLENAVYTNMKNDISFVFDFCLSLYEHQSTWNPNMPLRDLLYIAKLLENMTKDQDLYSSKPVKIPTPRFVVFYNGTGQQPDRQMLRLSDVCEQKIKRPELELNVTMYNINYGHNIELMEACKTLNEYAQYVYKVRRFLETMPLNSAVERAVDESIKEGILRDFLRKNKAEVIGMSIFEYNEELHIKNERAIAMEEGLKQGQQKNLVTLVCKKIRKNKSIERIADELETTVNDIRKIYDAACKCAPEYDDEKVFFEILNGDKQDIFLDFQTSEKR